MREVYEELYRESMSDAHKHLGRARDAVIFKGGRINDAMQSLEEADDILDDIEFSPANDDYSWSDHGYGSF